MRRTYSHVIFSHRWIGWDGPLRSIASVGVSAPRKFVRGHGPFKSIELALAVVGLIGTRSPASTSQYQYIVHYTKAPRYFCPDS